MKPGRIYDKNDIFVSTLSSHIVSSKWHALRSRIFLLWFIGQRVVSRKIMSREKNANQLTDRELEILHLLAEGWNNKQIAGKLKLTVRTIKFHTGNIYNRIDVRSRSEAIVWAWKHNEIQNLPYIETNISPGYGPTG